MSETDPSFDKLLDYLNRARGFDFSGYKVQGLQRRIQKRMQMVKVDDFASYVDFLEVPPHALHLRPRRRRPSPPPRRMRSPAG